MTAARVIANARSSAHIRDAEWHDCATAAVVRFISGCPVFWFVYRAFVRQRCKRNWTFTVRETIPPPRRILSSRESARCRTLPPTPARTRLPSRNPHNSPRAAARPSCGKGTPAAVPQLGAPPPDRTAASALSPPSDRTAAPQMRDIASARGPSGQFAAKMPDKTSPWRCPSISPAKQQARELGFCPHRIRKGLSKRLLDARLSEKMKNNRTFLQKTRAKKRPAKNNLAFSQKARRSKRRSASIRKPPAFLLPGPDSVCPE